MRAIWIKRVGWIVAAALVFAATAWFAWPRPVLVDLATLARAPMTVTVDDDGKTNVRHIYTVSAPIAGKVLRISHPAGYHDISRHVGDQVTKDESVVAIMQPMTPGFIDVRSREQMEAEVAAADAAVKQAEAEVQRLEAAVEFYRGEIGRAQALARTQTISAQALDKAKFDLATNEAALASAKAQIDLRRGIKASLAARLIEPSSVAAPADAACCVQIRAPASGRILRIVQDSEAVVPAGATLIEIGDPRDLEVIADLLTTEAVRIKPGAAVQIDAWGGPPLRGRVTRVDPAGFLKVSALGIEEQRVRVTIEFVDPPEVWALLGHDFRVTVHVTVWNADDVLTVPVGALFRKGYDWAVFVVKDGRARTVPVRIDHRNSRTAEVTAGLSLGDKVVLHPSDRVSDGTAVADRARP